ncbi:hypothetical protein D3C83_106670 [compost metagenome]
MHRRAEPGAVVRDAVEVQHRDLADPLLQHGDAGVDDLLPLLGRLVFGVFAQVAELARPLDLLRQVDLQLALERRNLIVEPLEDPFLHLDFQTLA